jgi:hypothetical protein
MDCNKKFDWIRYIELVAGRNVAQMATHHLAWANITAMEVNGKL